MQGLGFTRRSGGSSGGTYKGIYTFGAQNLAAAATCWLYPGNSAATAGGSATIAGASLILINGTMTEFGVVHGNPTGSTALSYRLYVNGIITAAQIPHNSGSTTSQINANIPVIAGDILTLEVTNADSLLLGVRAMWHGTFVSTI